MQVMVVGPCLTRGREQPTSCATRAPGPLPQGQRRGGVADPADDAGGQSVRAVTRVAMLANSHADAAHNCSQSPPESIPEMSMLPIQQTLAVVCPSHPMLRALARRLRPTPEGMAPSSCCLNMRTLGHSRRGHRDTCPTCDTLRAPPRAAPTTSQSPWPQRRTVVET